MGLTLVKGIKTTKCLLNFQLHCSRSTVDPEKGLRNVSGAVKLWWSAKTRCKVKDSRETTESHAATVDDDNEEDALVLDGWEHWIEQYMPTNMQSDRNL